MYMCGRRVVTVSLSRATMAADARRPMGRSALPSLAQAVEFAAKSMVPTLALREAEEKLTEARSAFSRSEEASQWLSTASKASVKALARTADEAGRRDAGAILQVAVESLTTAIEGAKEGGVDSVDIATAEELLETIRSSARRVSHRDGMMVPTALPDEIMQKYQHVLGPEA